jgi:hypothetical protein
MTEQQALAIISDLLNNSEAIGGQFAYAVAILAAIMTFIKRWGKLGFLFNKLPKSTRSLIPLILGGCIGACQAFMPYIGIGNLILGIVQGALVVGGSQMVLYQQVKHTPIETGLNKILDPLFKDGKFPLTNLIGLFKKS